MDETSGGAKPPDISQHLTNLSTSEIYQQDMEINYSSPAQYEEQFSTKNKITPNRITKRSSDMNISTPIKKSNSLQSINNELTLNSNNKPTLNVGEKNKFPLTDSTPISNTHKSVYEYNKNNRYSSDDKGPFFLLIESSNVDGNIGLLHHMSLGKLLITKFNLKNKDLVDIKKMGRNRIKVELNSYTLVNNLLNSDILPSNNLRGYIPETILYRKAVVRNVDPSLSNEEILDMIESHIEIFNVRRVTKKANINNALQVQCTQTVILTFRGQVLPDFVVIYGAKCKVLPYIYSVTQCLNCQRYGHISRQCRSNSRCASCGGDHISDNCDQPPEHINCINCKGPHASTSKHCPIYSEQKNIKKYMAFNNVGFTEARTKYRSFTQVLSTPPNVNSKEFPSLSTKNKFETLSSLKDQDDSNIVVHPAWLTKPQRQYTRPSQTSLEIHSSNNHNFRKDKQINTGAILKNPYPPRTYQSLNINKSTSNNVHNFDNNQNNIYASFNNDNYLSSFCSLINKFYEQNQGPISVDQMKKLCSSSIQTTI